MVRACVRACVRYCIHACVGARACACAHKRAYVGLMERRDMVYGWVSVLAYYLKWQYDTRIRATRYQESSVRLPPEGGLIHPLRKQRAAPPHATLTVRAVWSPSRQLACHAFPSWLAMGSSRPSRERYSSSLRSLARFWTPTYIA